MVTVPDFTGMDMAAARDTAVSSGLVFIARGNGVAQGQSPAAGTQVSKEVISLLILDYKLRLRSRRIQHFVV